MWASIKGYWAYFVASFHGSETIMWARCQLLLGVIYTALQATDIGAMISDKHTLQYYIFFNAIFTEVVRRHRSDFGLDPK